MTDTFSGLDKVFGQHPELLMAPTLPPVLSHWALWHSRLADAGLQRCNYYIKHLLIDSQGKCNQANEWLAESNDPKIVCHPIVVFIADIVWSGVAYLTFLYGKTWFPFTLLLFIASQLVLEHLNEGNKSETARTLVFSCRTLIYVCSMAQLIYFHI